MSETISKFGHGGARANSGGVRPGAGRPPKIEPATEPQVMPYDPQVMPYDPHWYCVLAQHAGESDAADEVRARHFEAGKPRPRKTPAEAAADEISAKGFEVFAPTIWKPATRARRNAVGALIPGRPAGAGPLFGRYIFSRFRLVDYWIARSELPSVETLLGLAPYAPTRMPERAMELIRGMCDANGCFHEGGDVPNSLVGALVRVLDGPFISFEGIVDWSDDDRVRVMLGIFGRECPTIFDQTAVEVV
jgi:transcription antitermination factor NusG